MTDYTITPYDAFSAGVKPGGLTSTKQIQILFCYLIRHAEPLTRDDLESALMEEELVNYFEIGPAIETLIEKEFINAQEDGFHITPRGQTIAEELQEALPATVREAAYTAVLRLKSWRHKQEQNHAAIQTQDGQLSLVCTIEGLNSNDFCLTLAMPDEDAARFAQRNFVERGSKIYDTLISLLTDEN